jgi:hypothetical protein
MNVVFHVCGAGGSAMRDWSASDAPRGGSAEGPQSHPGRHESRKVDSDSRAVRIGRRLKISTRSKLESKRYIGDTLTRGN